jgi:ubiquinone/menaquinone biosynthesis C-methylase UbiE
MYEKMRAKEVWGVDSSKKFILEAKRLVKHPERVLVSNMEKIPLKNKQFDIIVGRFSLHYLNNFDKAYKEFSRLLKPNGILLLCVNHPMIDLVQRKKLGYRQKEIVKTIIYEDILIKFPSHTIDEYFSKEFFKYFYIDRFIEDGSEDVYVNPKKAPDFMTFRAVKR